MKRRYRNMLNLFSISLLLVALYLNFVKKEAADFSAPAINATITNPGDTGNKESAASSTKQSEPAIVLK